VPGLIDYVFIDEAAMRRIATLHLFVNIAALAIVAINLWNRFALPSTSAVLLRVASPDRETRRKPRNCRLENEGLSDSELNGSREPTASGVQRFGLWIL
jgi:hypothetical protein